MAGNHILKFDVADDGSLSNRENFVFLNILDGSTHGDMWLGPDGMKVDAAGNLYITQYPRGEDGQRSCRVRPVISIPGSRPQIWSATMRADPQAIVQPR